MSELFGRYKTIEVIAVDSDGKITAKKYKIENNTFRIDFEIETKKTSDSNASYIKIYNPPKEFLEELKYEAVVRIDAGYKDYHNNIFEGIIEKIEIEDTNVDIIRKIYCSTNNKLWYRELISVSQRGIYAESIIAELTNKYSLTWGKKELGRNVFYARGKSYIGDLTTLLDEIATDCLSNFYINNGLCFMVPLELKETKTINISSSQGLKYIKKVDDSFEGEMLLNHDIQEGITITASYKGESFNFIVNQVKFISSNDTHIVWFKGD